MTCYPLIKTEMFAKSAFGTERTDSLPFASIRQNAHSTEPTLFAKLRPL